MPQSSYIDLEVIVLTKEGVWIADDQEISHEPTRKLFARSLKKDAEGYFLAIGHETKRIKVEDTAYFVERIKGENIAVISDGTEETIEAADLSFQPGRLTMKIKDGKEEAKFLRAPYHEILKDIEEQNGTYKLTINGKTTKL